MPLQLVKGKKMKLDERMKHYESTVGSRLILRCPAIVRIDGRAFHTFTKGFKKPFDHRLHFFFTATAKHLCRIIPTARIAYGQSDEISILLIDYTRHETQQFFDGKVQKISSVIASEASNVFNRALWVNMVTHFEEKTREFLKSKFLQAGFDARVFSIPERDVNNYFVWRQHDAIRNSIQAAGQAIFSHKELQGKSCNDIIEMLANEAKTQDNKYIDWNNRLTVEQRGYIARNQGYWLTFDAPDFSQEPNIVNFHLKTQKEQEEQNI